MFSEKKGRNLRDFFQKLSKWLKSLFIKFEKERPVKRLALIVGHSEKSGGAVNYKGESEYDFNSRIAKKVEDISNRFYESLEIKVFQRHGGSCRVLFPGISLYKPNATLELHFNAASVRAFGVEMLVYKHGPRAYENAMIGDIFTDTYAREYQVKQRHTHRLDGDSVSSIDGVKFLSEGRGVHNLKSMHECNVPFVLLFEPVFGNFETEESKAVFEDEDRYVACLVKAIGDIREFI